MALVAACAGPLAEDGSSVSLGTHSAGALRSGVRLPFDGDGYSIPRPWRLRDASFGTDELVGMLVRSTRAVSRVAPNGTAWIGDLSPRGGGRAVQWSPPSGTPPPKAPVPPYHFDVRRNWLFVRSLLTDTEAEVQWIFIHHALAEMLLREAAELGDDPEVIARAAAILHQPTDAQPHDDHMHIRVFCDPTDRAFGCADRGPVRWWKKRWKYMTPPFARSRATKGSEEVDVSNLLFRLIRIDLPGMFRGTGGASA